MDFGNYLQSSVSEIDREIKEFFQRWNKEVAIASPKLLSLSKLFAEHSEGGKRLRGVLVKLGFELAQTTDYRLLTTDEFKEILKPAAAFEIFQTAILVHDDIVDLSSTRRGKPTLYRVLGGDHYGISQTICLGDIGFFLAEKLISESDFPDNIKNKALASFIQTVLDTGLGEMLDVELPHSKDGGSEEDILTIFRLKTARYTIVGPLHLGAILGGADEKLLDKLAELGEKLGVAFQIQDDILGIFGDEKTLGKSVTSDIEEGKQTLLIAYACKQADKEQTLILNKYYGQGKIDTEALEKIRKVFIDTGALEYSQQKASKLTDEAKKIIFSMSIPEDKKNLLTGMASFIINRLK